MEIVKPFVGISGVTMIEEVRALAGIYNKHGFDSRLTGSHEPQISIFLSEQSLDKRRRGEQVGARFAAFDNVHLMVRVCRDFGLVPSISFITRERKILYENIMRVFGEEGIYQSCTRLQLQVISPEVDEKHLEQVYRIKRRYQKIDLSLNFARAAINQGDAVKHAQGYAGLANRVVIDFSCGGGTCFEPEKAAKYYEEIQQKRMDVGIGFAGGLDGETFKQLVGGLAERLNWNYGFSIDALSRLRDKRSEQYADDALNISKAMNYIFAASETLGQRKN